MLLVNFAHESLILQYTNGGEAGGGFPLGGKIAVIQSTMNWTMLSPMGISFYHYLSSWTC